MNDITNIEDIRTLVYSFYQKVRKDDLLAPVFNSVVTESQWPGHLEIMVSFWETNILFKPTYKGNPMQAHIKVDAEVNHTISQAYFDQWLKLWRETIDEHFAGENATITKKRAGDMAKLILYKIEHGRKGTSIS